MKDLIKFSKLFYENKVSSGDEKALFDLIKNEVSSYEIKTDALNNVILKKEGKNGKYIVFSTHLDTAGFIATYIDDKGRIKICCADSFNANACANLPVSFFGGAKGILSAKSEEKIKNEDLFVDVFEKTKKNTEKKVSLGEGALIDVPMQKAGKNGFFGYGTSTAFLLGAFTGAIKRLQSKDGEYGTIFILSAQRNLGARGISPALFGIKAEKAFLFDSVSSEEDGLILKVKEKRAISDKVLLNEAQTVLRDNNIKYTPLVFSEGEGELNAFLSCGIPAVEIDLPAKNFGTAVELISAQDAKNVENAIVSLAL